MHGSSAFPARVDPSRPQRSFQNVIKELIFYFEISFGCFDGNGMKLAESRLILIWGKIMSFFCDIKSCSRWKLTDVSEEHINSFFRAEEYNSHHLLHAGFLLDLFLDPEEGDICSKILVHLQRFRRHYIPEYRTFHNCRCENLKSVYWGKFIVSKYKRNILMPTSTNSWREFQGKILHLISFICFSAYLEHKCNKLIII
jgi:hypothetical protein